MSSKSFRPRANAALRRASNVASRSTKVKAEASPPSWKIETLEPRLLMSADLVPGAHSLEGAIDQPGEQDRFEFVVNEKTRFLFDGVQGDQIQWQLKGSNTTDQFDYRSLTSSGDRFLDLDPGTYSLTVDGLNDKTGAYAFRLMGVEAARPLTFGESTAGTLAAGTQAAMYSVQLEAGDRLYFQPAEDNGSGGWTLFDPGAVTVWGQNSLQTDRGPFVAPRAGTYWLSVEGQSGATSSVDYGFTMFKHAARSEPLVLGQTYTATLDRPGDAASYTFDLDRATQVQWDQLSASLGNVNWVIADAKTGGMITSGALSSQDGVQSPMRLAAGSYVLRVEGAGRGQGSASFRLLTASQATEGAAEVPVSPDDSLGGQVVRIDAASSGTLSLTYAQQSGAVGGTPNAQWVITDGNGVRLGNGTLSVGQIATVALPRAASYYLWTNTALSGGRPGVLRVAQWSDEAPTPVALDQVAPKTVSSNLQHSGQTLVHEITVGEGGVWAFEPTQLVEAAQWRLVGPRGTEFDWTALSASQGAAAGVRYLAPGTYRLEVRTTGLGTGVFSAAVTPFSSAAALVPGTPDDSLSNLAVGASAMLRADSVRYDDFKLAFSANTADFLVWAYDAYGRALTVSAAGVFSAGQANGAVFLRITRLSRANETPVQVSLTRTAGQAVGLGDVPDTLPRAVDVLVTSGRTVSVDVTIGDGANGTRDVDWYRVVLKAGEVLRLSTPNGSFDGYARVFDAAGAQVGSTDDSPLAYAVSSTGVYYVAISGYPNSNYDPFVDASGSSGATGTLSFTITREVVSQPTQNDTLANAKEVFVAQGATANTVVTIGEGASADLDVELVRILLVAGDRLDLGVPGSDFSQHLRLFDTNGVEQANATGDALRWTAGTTGVYYVGVSRAANKGYNPQTAPASSTASAGGSLTLTLVRTPLQAQAVTVKAIQPGVEVDDANSESGTPTYRFTQAADGWMALEWQAGNWTNWKLVGPRGIEANGTIREISSSDRSRTWSAPVRWLPAGEYMLELSGGSGAAHFTVNDAAHSIPIAVDTTVAVDLASTDAYAVFDVVLDADVDTYLRGLAGAGADNWYRLYDAGGVLLSQGNPATTAPTLLSVPRDGRYLLVVARNTFAAGGSALRFDLPTAPKVATVIALGDTVSGRFVSSYETRDFTFDVTTPSQLILTQNSSTGSAKTYQIRDANGNVIDKIAYYGNNAWGLETGRYTLRVQRSNNSTVPGLDDTFSLTFAADNDVRTLGTASNASLQVTTGVADGVLKMELQAGQSYWLTPAVPFDYYLAMRARVFDPSGNLVLDSTMGGGWWSAQGGVKINAAQTGTYTVVLGVWNSSSQGVTGNHAFKLRQGSLTTTALPVEGETTGTLSLGIDEARHRFTLTQPTRVWLNVAGDNYNASLVRTDVVSNSTVIGLTNISGSDLMRVIELPAGSYELLLQSTRDDPGSYRVKVADVANLPALSLGTAASTTVAQSQWATAWAYDGTAGQKLLVDPRVMTAAHGYWELLGPSGSSVASGSQYSSGDAFQRVTLLETGRYVLYFYGASSVTTARTSTILLREFTEPTTPVAVGTQVNATIAGLGNIDHYSFTLTDDTTIVLDPQGGATNLVLRGAVGTELNLGLSSSESFYVRRLAAGSYTIDVTPQNIATTPSYGFKLTTLQGIAVAHGEVSQLTGAFDVVVSADSATAGTGVLFETNAAGDAETNNNAKAGSAGRCPPLPENVRPVWRSIQWRTLLLRQALTAIHLFLKDQHYILVEDKVQIVDESTGRVMPDRSWEQGLHQLIEVKEGVEITQGRETMARMTFQRFFRRYFLLAGLTGTGAEASRELWSVYRLKVRRIPPNRVNQRLRLPDRCVADGAEKWRIVAEDACAAAARGQPVLVGTRSVEASEQIGAEFARRGVAHVVLNARQDASEAEIVGQAGQPGRITVATNMAGRGTDIKLTAQARAAGGLHVVLSEFHESPRVDRQLFGRSGRQGEIGSVCAVVCAQDTLFAALPAWWRWAMGWPAGGMQRRVVRLAVRWSQSRAERRAYKGRMQTLRQDRELNRLIGFAGSVT